MHRAFDTGVQRLSNGLLDYDHYRGIARHARRKTKTRIVRRLTRRTARRLGGAAIAIFSWLLWLCNIAPLGSVEARSKYPYI